MSNTDLSCGSIWRKWDLHVHSPASEGYKGSWHQFEQQLKNANCDVIGVNDYFSISGYRRTIERIQNGDLDIGDRVLFPVVEFRMRDVLKNKHESRSGDNLNFHIVFSQDIDLDLIETFIRSLKVDEGQIANKYDDKKFLKETAKVYFEQDVVEQLRSNKDFKDKFLILLPYNEHGGIDNIDPKSDDWIKRGFIKKTDLLGCSNKDQIDFFLWKQKIGTNGKPKFSVQKLKEWFGHQKACVKGSDSHSYEYPIGKLRNKDSKPIDKYCWIKADPTFEGLKQIVYEPEGRVAIQNNMPVSPVWKIEKVKIQFQANTEISLENKDELENFCFSGLSHTIPLSSYFTCFVGGRGTGKSTLLNLLYKALDPSTHDTRFLSNNEILHDRKKVNFSEVVKIEGSANRVEFLEQNQIEQFATDPIEFTKAIYHRIEDDDIESRKESLEISLRGINDQIKRIEEKSLLNQKLRNLEKKYNSAKKIVETNQTDEYIALTKKINESNKELIALRNDKSKLEDLQKELEESILRHTTEKNEADDIKVQNKEIGNGYKTAYNDAISDLEKIASNLGEKSFSKEIEKEENLDQGVKNAQEELKKYLSNLGLTEENLQDIQEANVDVDNYENEIKIKEKDVASLDQVIENFDLEDISRSKNDFVEKVKGKTTTLKQILEEVNNENPDDVDKIDLQVSFNEEDALTHIFDEFYNRFRHIRINENFGTSERDIRKCLFSVLPKDLFAGSKTLNDVREAIKGQNQYNKELQIIFEDESHFQIYKLIIAKHFLNHFNYLKIDVSYKGRPILQSSFGQRCTAVIVIMLLFGNSPIIIDEPEAHLDSSLIAKYLVKLIKRKKIERQIIFATHNANFVVNGDAELIYILDMPDQTTTFTSTTIENLTHRQKLLKLEGGKEAFELRGNKYDLKD